jgi:hypothetical protein
VLAAEGFIDRYEVKQADPGSDLMLVLRYGDRRKPRHPGLQAGLQARSPRLPRRTMSCQRVQGGLGVSIVSTSQGLMPDREARRRGSAARSWQRCGDMSRIGKMPVSVPSSVDFGVDGNTVSVKGPKGELP